MRKILCLMGLVCLFSLSAAAQDSSRIDLFGGYSYVHTSPGIALSSFNANGGVGSVAVNLNSWASIVGEVGGIHVSSIHGTDVDANALTFLAGPKISFFRRAPLTPFVQVLAGFAHSDAAFNTVSTSSFNGFALAPGVGLDWNVTHHVGLRLGQVDYLLTRLPSSTNQVNWNNFRYSAGVVFRF
jgi:opacity protein-like surface antigen